MFITHLIGERDLGLREIESEKQCKLCNGTQGLVREIENFERSGVREIGSKFALLYREKKRDCSFTSRDRELREIGVRAIESHLYVYSVFYK